MGVNDTFKVVVVTVLPLKTNGTLVVFKRGPEVLNDGDEPEVASNPVPIVVALDG